LHELDVFAGQCRPRKCGESGNVAAWPGQVRHEAGTQRIGADQKDWDRRGCSLRGMRVLARSSHDHIYWDLDEFRRERVQAFLNATCLAKLKAKVSSFSVPMLSQAFSKCVNDLSGFFARRREEHPADPIDLGLLRLSRKERGDGENSDNRSYPPIFMNDAK